MNILKYEDYRETHSRSYEIDLRQNSSETCIMSAIVPVVHEISNYLYISYNF